MNARKGFTLLELMVAVLLGAFLTLMIAGVLRNSILAWETVEKNVSLNYNRRTVLDMVKRQSSSLFFKRELDQITQSNRFSRRPGRNRNNRMRNLNQRDSQGAPGDQPVQPVSLGFDLPAGAYFLRGGPQEISFLSTVSFLSDFPGQVAVRYFVIQGEPEEDEGAADLPSSRSLDIPSADDLDDLAPEPGYVPEALEGNLYLYVEEMNLFLSASNEATGEFEGEGLEDGLASGGIDAGSDQGFSQPQSRRSMKLLGPLRKFTIRYRQPASRRANEQDSEEDWAETWDVDTSGNYPSAVEFIMLYEVPGVTDDLPDEELEGIRMVIPVYDARNLARGGGFEPF